MSQYKTSIRPRLNKETIQAHNEALSAELDEKLGIEPSEYSAPTRPMVFSSREQAPQILNSNTSNSYPLDNVSSSLPQSSRQHNHMYNTDSKVPVDVQRQIEDGKKAMDIVVKGIKENDTLPMTGTSEKEPTPQGFPQAEHRSKRPMSKFRAARLAQKQKQEPLVHEPPKEAISKQVNESYDDPELEAISKENQAIIDSMSPEQIRREQEELRNQLDPATIAFLMNRKRNKGKNTNATGATDTSMSHANDNGPESGELTPGGKHTRFSQSKPEVFTYPAEPHELRKPIAFLPPPENKPQDVEKDTPEFIRKNYFPEEPSSSSLDPAHDPLAWLRDQSPKQNSTSPASSEASIPHFDINGNFIERKPPSYSTESHKNNHTNGAASHQHLHHHHAGEQVYTIPSVLALTSSSVMGQRVSAFSIIQKIVQKNLFPELNDQGTNDEYLTNQDLDGILSRASQAIDDRGLAVAGNAVSVLSTLLCTDEWITSNESSTINRRDALRRYCFQQLFQYKPITPFTRFQRHMENGTLPRSTLLMACRIILSMLRTPSINSPVEGHFDPIDFIVDSERGLLETIVARFVAVSWPPSSSISATSPEEWPELGQGLPSVSAANIILEIATQSQAGALELLSRQLIDPFSRYLAITPWSLWNSSENEEQKKEELALQKLHYSMLSKLLDILAQLSKYKIGDEMCMAWAPLFSDVNHHFDEVAKGKTGQQDADLAQHWNSFLDAFEKNFDPNPMSFPRRNF